MCEMLEVILNFAGMVFLRRSLCEGACEWSSSLGAGPWKPLPESSTCKVLEGLALGPEV